MWGDIPTPHGPCSYCFNPYYHVRDCPEMRQFSNYHYEHMNTSFSRPGNDFHSDSYNPAWSQHSNFSRQGLKGNGVYEVNGNNGVQTRIATMERKLDMLVKVMTTHNIWNVPYVLILITPLSKRTMWARITILQRTIHTPTFTMQGDETTPIFHGVTIKMSRIHKGKKEISSKEITIKLHHK